MQWDCCSLCSGSVVPCAVGLLFPVPVVPCAVGLLFPVQWDCCSLYSGTVVPCVVGLLFPVQWVARINKQLYNCVLSCLL